MNVRSCSAGDTKDMAPSTYAGPDAQKPAGTGAGVSARPKPNTKCEACSQLLIALHMPAFQCVRLDSPCIAWESLIPCSCKLGMLWDAVVVALSPAVTANRSTITYEY